VSGDPTLRKAFSDLAGIAWRSPQSDRGPPWPAAVTQAIIISALSKAPEVGVMNRLPPVFAVRRISDYRWELVGPDDDPRRPPWRRWLMLDQAAARSRSAISTLVCPPSTDKSGDYLQELAGRLRGRPLTAGNVRRTAIAAARTVQNPAR
jgi:hypothetical protein